MELAKNRRYAILLIIPMDSDVFNIYIEQLRDGQVEKIDEVLDPGFLDVDEADLSLKSPVQLYGEAYLADHELVLHWNIRTEARVPCVMCNELVAVPLVIDNFYASEMVAEIKSGVFNYRELLRETILLEVPPFVECCSGSCPKRQELSHYIKVSSDRFAEENGACPDGFRPFADLDWKE